MFLFLSERLGTCYGHIFEEKEWLRIANTKWSEVIDIFEILHIDKKGREDALYGEGFFWEIGDIMYGGYLFPYGSFEGSYIVSLYRESSSLAMSTISDEVFFAVIQEFYEIAPFWRTT